MSLYLEIANQFKRQIKLGVLPANSRLPHEIELAESLAVTRKTLRNALSVLEDEKLITRKKRLGTFIADNAEKIVHAKFTICIMGDFGNTENSNLFFSGQLEDNQTIPSKIAVQKLLADNIDVKFVSSKGIAEIPEDVDGFIIVDAIHSSFILKKIADAAVPHVSFETHLEYPGVNTVMADDNQAVNKCVKELYKKGHRRIAFQGGALKRKELNSGIRRRTDAFKDTCDKLGIDCKRWIYNFDASFVGIPDFNILSAKILSDASQCTATVCALGKGALSLLDLCEQKKIDIPNDLEMMCVDTITYDMRQDEIDRLCIYPGFFKPREKTAYKGLKELFKWIGNSDEYKPKCHKVLFEPNK